MSSNQQQTLTPNGNITSAAGAATLPKQPPTWFDLSEIDPNQALIDIRHFTHNFEGMHDVDFRERFDNSINRHFGRVNKPVIIGYIPAPPKTNANNIDVVKKIIGQNGYWLKKTTENCGVHFKIKSRYHPKRHPREREDPADKQNKIIFITEIYLH